MVQHTAAPSEREAAVLERIEAVSPSSGPPHRRGRDARPRRRRQGLGGAGRRGVRRRVRRSGRHPAPRCRRGHADPERQRLAFSTDSFVVQALRFPGGSIGDLAVHGTVNDLAVPGARPRWLSAAFVIEEGFAGRRPAPIDADMAAEACRGVAVVTGDTKVVHRGTADASTSRRPGSGSCMTGRWGSELLRPGDNMLSLGHDRRPRHDDMVARGDLDLDTDIRSDSAPLGDCRGHARGGDLDAMDARPDARRVGTRSATRSRAPPICDRARRGAPPGGARRCRARARSSASTRSTSATRASSWRSSPGCGRRLARRAARAPVGRDATVVGEVRADPPGIVVMNTAFGGTRIVDMLVGEQLPRIC